MNEFVLKDIRHECHPTKRVCDWNYVEPQGREDAIRLYYTINDNSKGFDFYAVQLTGSYSEKKPWCPFNTLVDCLYQGIALFDGVRHLYSGDNKTDNYGYDYYPVLNDHIAILAELRKLEILHCPSHD